MNKEKPGKSRDELAYPFLMHSFIMKSNDALSHVVEEDLAAVDSIDKQILSLVRQRNYVLYGLNHKCFNCQNAAAMLGRSPESIWKDYKTNSFNGQHVKEAVAAVRALFFDDSQDKFRSLLCTYVDYGEGHDNIGFMFEDNDGHAMCIMLDAREHEDQYYLYNCKRLNGYMYFRIKDGHDYITAEQSMSIRDVKSAIEKWIDDGFTAAAFKFELSTLLQQCSDVFKEFEHMSMQL